jgi:hypothetical protein
LPVANLSASNKAAVISLLDRESLGAATPVDPAYAGPTDETWPEYIVTLTDAVIRVGDATALRGISRLGLQTSVDAKHFVGDFGASALPYLDSAWALSPTARPAIVGTWGYMLRPGSSLGADSRATVQSHLLAPDDTFHIEPALAAQQYQLVALLPLIDSLRRVATDPSDSAILASASAELTPLYNARPPSALMGDLTDWINGMCAHPTLLQLGYCTSIKTLQITATGLVSTHQYVAARAVLQSIAQLTIDNQRLHVIGGLQAEMIVAEARRIASRLS